MSFLEKTRPVSVLVIKLRFHGDVLLTTPVISSLKKNYPDSRVDVLVYSETAPMIEHHPDISQIIYFKKRHPSFTKKLSHILQVLRTIRKNRYTMVINLSDQWLTALSMRLINTRMSLGQGYHHRQHWLWKMCFDQVVPVQGEHIVERNLSVLTPLNLPYIEQQTSIRYPQPSWDSLKARLHSLDVAEAYVIVQPTARQIFKCWDEDKFATVIDYLIMDKHLRVVLTCGPGESDKAMVKRIASLCKSAPVTALAGETSLPQLAALIDHSRLFIGVDSAPLHIAAALNKPIICLFGATNHHVWRPWTQHFHLILAGDYQPMPDRNHLDRQHRYLSCIPADAVIQRADKALG